MLPKPPGISESLLHPVGTAALTADDVTDLRRKGFYLTPNGQLISDRGELVVRTLAGVYYTLRFGDLSLDTQSSPAAPSANAPAQGTAPTARVTENRYLFIMAEHVPGQAISQREAGRGEQLVDVLRSRFAPWYYVISTESFEALRLGRRAFVSGRG